MNIKVAAFTVTQKSINTVEWYDDVRQNLTAQQWWVKKTVSSE